MSNAEFLKEILLLDYKGIAAEYILHNISDVAIKNLRKYFLERNEELKANKIIGAKLSVSEEIVLKGVIYNFTKTYNWCKEIHLKSAIESKDLLEIFIDLELYITQVRERFEPDELLPTIASHKIFENIDKNIIIYGGSGAGKSTLMMNICRQIFDTEHSLREFSCPIVIQFRDIDYTKRKKNKSNFGLYDILKDTFGIEIKFPENKTKDKNKENNEEKDKKKDKKKKTVKKVNEDELIRVTYNYIQTVKSTVTQFIDDANLLLIFDGFDEIPDLEIKDLVEKNFQELALSLNKSKFILTSRNGEFNSSLANTRKFEICPLNDKQILSIVTKWLKDEELIDDFIRKIKSSPFYDTAIRPLTITHLCIIYERKKTIPPKPSSVYKYVVDLMLEKWDDQRKVIRNSTYGELFLSDMSKFLYHISYKLSYNIKTNLFSSRDLQNAYLSICNMHNLPASEVRKVVREIESHNGLIIQVGSDSYQFTHKSLQEYLTAEYITGLSAFPKLDVISSMPNEIAISISLSTDNSEFFNFFIKNIKKFSYEYWLILLNRIHLEKPSFTDSNVSLIFFISILSLSYSNWLKEYQYDSIKKIIVLIINDTNIKIATTDFYKLYKRYDIIDKYIVFEHKNLKTSLPEREYREGRLYLEEDIYNLIF